MKYKRSIDAESKITTKQLALLHVAKHKLALTEADYRSVLSLYGNVESAKDLTIEGFRHVMSYLERVGFRNQSGKVYQWKTKAPQSDPDALPYPAQLNKLQALFAEMNMDTTERQQAFCQRQIKKAWPQTRAETNKVIEGLKAMLARTGKS